MSVEYRFIRFVDKLFREHDEPHWDITPGAFEKAPLSPVSSLAGVILNVL
jgi:hypothetical protein